MTLSEAVEICDYWRSSPPEHEILALLARAYTTWEPGGPQTPEEAQSAHRKSLQARWNAGAMDAKQLFEAMGGKLSINPPP